MVSEASLKVRFHPSVEATVTAMRALLKGRPELQREFAARVTELFGEAGFDLPQEVAVSLIPAVPSEFRSERAHVVAFDD